VFRKSYLSQCNTCFFWKFWQPSNGFISAGNRFPKYFISCCIWNYYPFWNVPNVQEIYYPFETETQQWRRSGAKMNENFLRETQQSWNPTHCLVLKQDRSKLYGFRESLPDPFSFNYPWPGFFLSRISREGRVFPKFSRSGPSKKCGRIFDKIGLLVRVRICGTEGF